MSQILSIINSAHGLWIGGSLLGKNLDGGRVTHPPHQVGLPINWGNHLVDALTLFN